MALEKLIEAGRKFIKKNKEEIVLFGIGSSAMALDVILTYQGCWENPAREGIPIIRGLISKYGINKTLIAYTGFSALGFASILTCGKLKNWRSLNYIAAAIYTSSHLWGASTWLS